MKSQLSQLRTYLSANRYDGFILPRSDAYLGEYVAPRDEALAWLTGFTGSAGFALITPNLASLYTDGRYQTQGAAELKDSGFALHHSSRSTWYNDLIAAHPTGGKLAFDPWLHSIEWYQQTTEKFGAAPWHLVAAPQSPLETLWHNRPAAPLGKVALHPLEFAGETSASKCTRLAEKLCKENVAAEFVNDPTLVAWLLNIRGSDLEFTPIAQARAILHSTGQVELFIAPEKIAGVNFESHITAHAPAALTDAIAAFSGSSLRLPANQSPYALLHLAEAAGVKVDTKDSVIVPARAIKNEVEIAGMRAAHMRDGKVLTKLYAELPKLLQLGLTEHEVAMKIIDVRQPEKNYFSESFPAIVGWKENGAIVHYRPHATDSAKISGDGILLIDCGAQYYDGTTDITRTIAIGAPTAWQREVYTRVLKGHLAIARVQFPVGTTGRQLDILARQALWEIGLDFEHGTGHGVGSFLSVHEGPQRISQVNGVTLEAGMILSNEPGCYLPGEFGVRIENLILVVPAEKPGFLCFETITRVPYDTALIDDALLTPTERNQIVVYHHLCHM